MFNLRLHEPFRPRILVPRSRCLVMAAGLLLASLSPAAAQTTPAAGPDAAPAREGNVYDHRDHQPTASEVHRAEGLSGSETPSAATDKEVERGVEDLLRQTDKMDEAAEKQGQGFPPGVSSQSPQ